MGPPLVVRSLPGLLHESRRPWVYGVLVAAPARRHRLVWRNLSVAFFQTLVSPPQLTCHFPPPTDLLGPPLSFALNPRPRWRLNVIRCGALICSLSLLLSSFATTVRSSSSSPDSSAPSADPSCTQPWQLLLTQGLLYSIGGAMACELPDASPARLNGTDPRGQQTIRRSRTCRSGSSSGGALRTASASPAPLREVSCCPSSCRCYSRTTARRRHCRLSCVCLPETFAFLASLSLSPARADTAPRAAVCRDLSPLRRRTPAHPAATATPRQSLL